MKISKIISVILFSSLVFSATNFTSYGEAAPLDKSDIFTFPSDYIDNPEIAENYDQISAVVNKHYQVPADYVPDDLVTVSMNSTQLVQLREVASLSLTKLYEAVQSEGLDFLAVSGHRTDSFQSRLYSNNVASNGVESADTFSARPGHSEHQLGLAIDVSHDGTLEEYFGETKVGMYINDNAHNYGFIISYPKGKTDLTGYIYEPWHLRYVGENYATMIYNSGLTMSEFMQLSEMLPFVENIGEATASS